MSEPRKAKRGRPVGAVNRPANATLWEPKDWKPLYEQIVLLSISGRNNKDIAHVIDRTPAMVGMVLRSQAAKKRQEALLKNVRETVFAGVDERIAEATVAGADKIHKLMTEEQYFEASPFAVADRAIKLLQGSGKLGAGEKAAQLNVDKMLVLAGDQSAELVKGLLEANEVQRMHEKQEIGMDIISENYNESEDRKVS